MLTTPIDDEITLELSRLQRAAFARVRQRAAEQQLGEAWVGLAEVLHQGTAASIPADSFASNKRAA